MSSLLVGKYCASFTFPKSHNLSLKPGVSVPFQSRSSITYKGCVISVMKIFSVLELVTCSEAFRAMDLADLARYLRFFWWRHCYCYYIKGWKNAPRTRVTSSGRRSRQPVATRHPIQRATTTTLQPSGTLAQGLWIEIGIADQLDQLSFTDYQALKSQRGGALHKVQFLRGEGVILLRKGFCTEGGPPLLPPPPLGRLWLSSI